ncbi:MAG: C4-type zinc ribbon domain-containing protein [Clostridiales bacterium]|nr:C4-type zinc ribbon domain-containing protein [Clostridiales bacterium]MDY5350492.1 C4-type zinc ribbon domain-containing protein [Candidatus Ventricola sp.]MDY5515534.1 C4-type zinc ribbon domain-containing protein [Candidatus Ventricola sp.]
MEQYERLWQYQQVDMELDQYEKEMRGNSNRKELLKHRDFLLEQQNVLKKIEADVEIMSDRMEALADEITRLNGSVSEATANFEANRPQDIEEARKQIAAIQKLISTISRYEAELTKMRKDSEARDRQQREVRVRAAKARAEFDRIKIIYDEEYKVAAVKLEALKKKVAKEAEGIDPALMEKYKAIKRHSTPPITRIHDDRCGGCNMQLPAADMNKIRTGAPYVECENCGRIILVK